MFVPRCPLPPYVPPRPQRPKSQPPALSPPNARVACQPGADVRHPLHKYGYRARYRYEYRTIFRTMYEHANSVLTTQPHWATTGSQKGALGASRAAWRARSTQPWSHLKLLRSGHKHDCAQQSQVRAFCVDVGLQELVSPHPSLWRPARQVAHPLTKAQDHSVAHWRQRN